MECKAVEEYKALERKIDRLTVRMWVIIITLLILSGISNLIWLFAFLRSQTEFEYVVEETTEVETIVEQDGEGQNLAVVGNNNNIGGKENGAENYKENNNNSKSQES